jgi:hypothetical protein
MAKYVQLPDNSRFPVEEGEDYATAMRAAYAKYPEAFGAASTAAAPQTGIMADIKGAGANLMNIGRTGFAALTGDTTQAAEAGVARQEELQKKYKSGFDPEKVEEKFKQGEYLGAAGEALSQAPSAIAGIAPSVAQEAALALAGRVGGGAIGALAGPAGSAIGAQIGQYAVPFVVNAIQALGSQAQEKVQTQREAGEKVDVDAAQLAPYAAGNAALNLIGTKIGMPGIFKKMGGEKVAGEVADAAAAATRKEAIDTARKVAGRGTFETILRGTGGFALGELPTEVLQDVVDRAAVGKDLTDEDAFKSYRSTALNMLLASPLGGGFGVQQRSGARDTVATEDKVVAAKNAQQAAFDVETAANTPEALTKLDTDYQAAAKRMQELQAATAKKPTKASTDEERAAYNTAKAERDTFQKEEFAPIKTEYEKRKDAIGQMQDKQLTDLEQAAAEGQPTADALTPNAAITVPMPKLMERYDQLRSDLGGIEDQMAAGPDLETHRALSQQRQALSQQADAYGQLLESRGGLAMTAEEHGQAVLDADKAIARQDVERKKHLTNGAFPEADKAIETITKMQQDRDALAAKRPLFQETQAYKESKPGETQQMFSEQEMPAPIEQKVPEFASPEGKEITPPAPVAEIEPSYAVKLASANLQEVSKTGTKEAIAEAKQAVQKAAEPEIAPTKSVQFYNERLAEAVQAKDISKTGEALHNINEEENKIARSRALPAKNQVVWDLFSTPNLLANGDPKTIEALTRAGDLGAQAQRDAKSREEKRMQQVLDERLGLGGAAPATELDAKGKPKQTGEPLRSVKRERANLFDVLYDDRAKALFTNGNSLEQVEQQLEKPVKKQQVDPSGKPLRDSNGELVFEMVNEPVFDSKGRPVFENVSLQDVYDKGGPAAVETAVVMDQIRALKKKVETPQGNAKKSLYQMMLDMAAEHESLLAQRGEGLAAQTMGEKAATLQAKLGKGEAPAARQMTAKEKDTLNRKITSIENQYNAVLGKVEPIRKQIETTYAGLYTTAPLETVEKEREAKKALLLPETGARSMSRTARTQARIESGDVRKEAETSAKMRDLALKLGQQESEYETFATDLSKRRAKLVAKYGKSDPAVLSFSDTSFTAMQEKAMALGKATPEYKATLKEQIEVTKEALAGSKQTLKSKRGTQTTRKVSLAKKEQATGSPESREEGRTRHSFKAMSVAEQERVIKEVNDSEGGTAYRVGGAAPVNPVDPAEAQKFIDGVKANLPANVKFVYAATPGKIPVRLLNMMAAEKIDPNVAVVQGAVFSDGTVLVVGDQHSSLLDLEQTVAHELIGHYGIDTIIGMERLGAYAEKTDLLKLAEEIGGAKLLQEVNDTIAAQARAGKGKEVQDLQALREIIAHTEEARVTEAFRDKAQRWIKELVGMVRSALRQMGFTKLPAMSASDVFYALRQSRKAFENKTIGVYRDKGGAIAFRMKHTPGEFDATPEPSAVNTFLGNVLGLAGRQQFVDKWASVSAAFKAGMKAGVLTDVEAGNAEFLMRFSEHRSQYAGQFLTNGPVSLVTEKTDKGLIHTYKSTKGANPVEMAEALSKGGFTNDSEAEGMLTTYVAGQRATQVGWDKLNYSDPAAEKAKYQRLLAILASDPKRDTAIKEAAKVYQQFNNGLMEFLVQTGELTAAKAAELKAITYIPFYRVNAQGEVQLMIDKEHPIRIGNVKDEPQLHELVGDNKQIMPIFASMVQNTFMLTNMALRNQSVKETAFALRKTGIVSRIAEGKGPASADTVRFKVKGKDFYAIIDTDAYGIPAKYIVQSMEGIKTTIPALVRMLGVPADLLRTVVTRAPTYAVRQVIRDPLNAWLVTGTDAFPVLSSFKELASMMAGTSETGRLLTESGAVSSNVFTGDVRDMGRVFREITTGKSGWGKLMARADALAMQADSATRAVIYKDSIDKGMSHQAALLRAVESMNFGRRGLSPSMQVLNTLIPFFNAQIQGLDVLYRAFRGEMSHNEQLKIREKLVKRGLLLAMGTMAYAVAMQDDEAYKRAKPEERFGNWFVYVPGFSEPLRIPIPFELGYLFKALPEAIVNLAMGDTKSSEVLKGMGKLLGQSQPLALPQAVKPLTEVVLGASFYGGDIESQREKGMMATDRYRESSTEIAKLLGSVTGMVGISPIKIDHLIRGYTGGLGIALVQLANPILNTEAGVEKPSMKPSKMPFLGGLFQPVEGRGTLDMAYDRMLEIQQVKGSYNRLIEQGKRAEAKEFAQTYANQLAMASTSGSVQKALGQMAAQERMIRSSKMTTEQKDEALGRLDKMKVAYARQFINLADRTTPQ